MSSGTARRLERWALLSVLDVMIFSSMSLAGCNSGDSERIHRDSATVTPGVSAEPATGAAQPPLAVSERSRAVARARRECEERIERAERQPVLGGTPALDARRVQIFLEVKGEPALFIRPPEYAPDSSPEAVEYRATLARSNSPGSTVAGLIRTLRARPELLRSVLLRDDYLYADDVPLAKALVSSLRADLLFRSDEVTIERGDRTLVARRDPSQRRYVYVDGPHAGRPVALVLFDRVSQGPLSPPLHRDVRSLRYRLGYRRLRARHLSAEQVVADLGYGDVWVPTLLTAHGAHLELDCEAMPEGRDSEVQDWRLAELARARAVAPLQRIIADEIDERLPFDEPRHEIGQEDGELRGLWQAAYLQGAAEYTHRGDRYRVFDPMGRPLVPQVCVDFVLDTLERCAGTWWRSRDEPASRHVGRLDLAGAARGPLRRASEFVRYAQAHPRWFDVLEIEGCDRVPMGREQELGEWLSRRARDFVPGDIVLIAGCVPWDPLPNVHYHAFFVFESDPLTGMPLAIAGNAGRPRLSTWGFEMLRTPDRTLRYRLRPAPAWLASIAARPAPTELEPPPLSTPLDVAVP
jgi:hypothetical protein